MVETGLTPTYQYGIFTRQMNQRIIGFDLDPENYWRAKLSCGHYQHVRHDPPLRTREWVLTESGRASRIGELLECKKCDDKKLADF